MAPGFAAIKELPPVIAYIGLGANLGEPKRQIKEALVRLATIEAVELRQVSSFYLNPPLGPQNQPWFVNAVAQIRTRIGPEALLKGLERVEAALGRVKEERWGPRLIDLDLLLYNGVVRSGPRLILPHPQMHRRAFVLVPLAEIDPEAWHPVLQKSAAELLAELDAAALAALRPDM
jgi:2-amino-4-hydroxy-6-hydroxymethyldihydropteridine diphosphokinase